jgi:hypothetical protein
MTPGVIENGVWFVLLVIILGFFHFHHFHHPPGWGKRH